MQPRAPALRPTGLLAYSAVELPPRWGCGLELLGSHRRAPARGGFVSIRFCLAAALAVAAPAQLCSQTGNGAARGPHLNRDNLRVAHDQTPHLIVIRLESGPVGPAV